MAFAASSDSTLALNPQGLGSLRTLASHGNTREGVKAAASQFEAYFAQMMLRSMRQTLPQDGLFDSAETRSFTEMYDQQLAQKMSQGKGLGLADMMLAQLDRLAPANKGGDAATAQTQAVTDVAAPQAATEATTAIPTNNATPAAAGFIDRVWSHAVEAARSLGVSPKLLVAHAALETGWGKHELKGADGSASNNLFNIKAGGNWKGKTVEASVTEYVNGKPVKSTETFRAYNSPAESFSDYASLLGSNSRYAGVLNQDAEGYVRGLQRGGFATDPAYADKLRRVIGSTALKVGLAG